MQALPSYRQDVRNFFNQFPCLREHINEDRVRCTEIKECRETIIQYTPESSDTILLLDQHGRKICNVGQVPGFRIWKVWKWFANLTFTETVGEAIIRVRNDGYEPKYILFYNPDSTREDSHIWPKLTIYTNLPDLVT